MMKPVARSASRSWASSLEEEGASISIHTKSRQPASFADSRFARRSGCSSCRFPGALTFAMELSPHDQVSYPHVGTGFVARNQFVYSPASIRNVQQKENCSVAQNNESASIE